MSQESASTALPAEADQAADLSDKRRYNLGQVRLHQMFYNSVRCRGSAGDVSSAEIERRYAKAVDESLRKSGRCSCSGIELWASAT